MYMSRADDTLYYNNKFTNPEVGDVRITSRGTDYINTNAYVNRQRNLTDPYTDRINRTNLFPYDQKVQILDDFDDPVNHVREGTGNTSGKRKVRREYGSGCGGGSSDFAINDEYVKISRVNIDSADRNISPKNILESTPTVLPSNPLTFSANSNVVTVNHPNHGYEEDDRITISNVINMFVTLRDPLEMEAGSSFVKINHPNHGIQDAEDDINDLQITISCVSGNTQGGAQINNIPVNIINTTHTLLLRRNPTDLIDPNAYFIQLPLTATSDFDDDTDNIDNIVKVKFLNLAGVPLNLINADYPLDINQAVGFQTISNIVDENTYQFEMNTNAAIDLVAGGNNVLICRIVDTVEGFPNPNSYKIRLDKTFYNVKRIKLVSTEFPNTQKNIRDTPASLQNNTLVWQNLNDGDVNYTLSVQPGNYTAETLAAEIKRQWELIPRQNLPVIDNTDVDNVVEQNQFHSVEVSIDTVTNIVTFRSFDEFTIDRAIEKSTETFPDRCTRILVKHENHGLQAGDTVIIENAIATDGIPASVLNAEHVIEELRGTDKYNIKLPLFNEDGSAITFGGVAVKILTPMRFRMFFDQSGTLGNVLGFRNVEAENAVTSFETIVANNKPYEIDFLLDEVGNPIVSEEGTVQNNIVDLSGGNYILMTCAQFNNSYNTGPVTNVFAKLLLTEMPGTIIFNEYVQLAFEFDEQIPAISEMDFQFYFPSGELFDFNNIDHSFTVEFHENNNELKNTQISSRTGINTRTGRLGDLGTFNRIGDESARIHTGNDAGNLPQLSGCNLEASVNHF